MLATTIGHVCLRCGSEKIRQNGHAEHGAQRAKCLACGSTFVLRPEGARHDQRSKDQVLAACQDRLSLRGITRTFGVCRQTMLRWVGERSGQLPACVDPLLPARKGDVPELDELWSFVRAKAQTLWRRVALCRRTRQIVAWTLGDRSEQGGGGPASRPARSVPPLRHPQRPVVGGVPSRLPNQNASLLSQAGG